MPNNIIQLPYTAQEILALLRPPVNKPQTILSDQRVEAGSELEVDLSSYLPDDDNYYEVYVSGWINPIDSSKNSLVHFVDATSTHHHTITVLKDSEPTLFHKRILISASWRKFRIKTENIRSSQTGCIISVFASCYKLVGKPQASNS